MRFRLIRAWSPRCFLTI